VAGGEGVKTTENKIHWPRRDKGDFLCIVISSEMWQKYSLRKNLLEVNLEVTKKYTVEL
jgi:hypothetical protein